MELNTPRHDPYDIYNKTLEELKKEGYNIEFEVLDKTTCKDSFNKRYTAQELTIDKIYRFKDRPGLSEDSQIVAVNASDGAMGVITSGFGADSNSVVSQFMQNIDRGDDLNEYFV